jgi:hypothetical protein
MDQFKIDLFEESFKRTFPSFHSLNHDEMNEMIGKLSLRLGFDEPVNGSLLLKAIIVNRVPTGVNAQDYNFRLDDFLHSLQIVPNGEIFINWHSFDKIDLMAFSDFTQYFDDIWFPGPDDIEVFDCGMDWILSIAHDGDLRIVDLRQ